MEGAWDRCCTTKLPLSVASVTPPATLAEIWGKLRGCKSAQGCRMLPCCQPAETRRRKQTFPTAKISRRQRRSTTCSRVAREESQPVAPAKDWTKPSSVFATVKSQLNLTVQSSCHKFKAHEELLELGSPTPQFYCVSKRPDASKSGAPFNSNRVPSSS
jgi:hypothetical protein